MAVKNKQKNNNTNSDSSSYIISPDKKKKLVGLFLLILSLLVFFSILSYTRKDSANLVNFWTDFIGSFSPDAEFVSRQQNTYNWLGIFGAYTSDFLINNTIGIFSIFLTVVLFLFGYSIIFKQKSKLFLKLSNFLLTMGILLSSFMGLLRFKFGVFADLKELSGKIGEFLGQSIGFLLGGLGGIIFFFFAIFLTIFLTFDINFSKVGNWFKYLWSDVLIDKDDNVNDNDDEDEDSISNKAKSKKEDIDDSKKKLDKIKDLKDNSKAKPRLSALKEVFEDDEEEEDTRIEIVRKVNDTKDAPKSDDKAQKPEDKIKKDKDDEKTKSDSSFVPNNDDDIKLSDDLPKVDLAKELKKEEKLPEQWEEEINFKPIPLDMFTTYPNDGANISDEELKRNAELLTEKLALFDIKIEDIKVHPGPVVTMYEIVPSPGVKISRIVSLESDIALALAARGIRIIAPIPGKSAIGVEIPNATASMVSARSVLEKIREFKGNLPLAFGKEINGDIHIADLSTIPHLLVAGSTGSGKSVGINMMIMSLIYTKHPSDVKFVIIDPKKIELSFYQKLNKHYLAVSPDLDEEIITTPANALIVLKAAVLEMEKRYDMLAKAGARNILEYNKKIADTKRKPADTGNIKHHKLPYIVIIIDELADLMITAGKEVEEPIARIAQLARAVGIHLVVATQRPSVNVITGVIKANFSARIAYQVATKIDSRTILDMNGAEQLLGRGDMLYLPAGYPKPVRIQNAFVSTEEVEDVTNYVYAQKGFSKRYLLPSIVSAKGAAGDSMLSDLDPMFEEAALCIMNNNQASVSLLQRKLKLGYARAARIMDQLEQAGVVSAADGGRRVINISSYDELDAIMKSL